MDPFLHRDTRRALTTLKKAFDDEALRTVFADIRAHPDAALLANAGPAIGAGDPLLSAVTALLAPFPLAAPVKAAMLVDRLETLVGRKLKVRTRTLAGAVRALQRLLSADDIRDGAFSLRVTLSQPQASSRQKEDIP